MSMTVVSAVPKMLLILVPNPGVHPFVDFGFGGQAFGSPARIAASRTPVAVFPPSARSMFSCAKTVLTESARAFLRSMRPYDLSSKFLTSPRLWPASLLAGSANSGKNWGPRPSYFVLVLMSFWRAASSPNTLNVDPPCIWASVESLNWRLPKSLPPYIATMAPSPGLIAVSPTCRSSAVLPDGILSATALTAASCAFLSIVVTTRRPPRSMSLSAS